MGDLICFNYADLQDPLELIVRMGEKISEGNDIVWAHRESTKVSFGEKAFSSFYAYLMRKFAFKNFPEKGFDIVMFNRKVAFEINSNVEANSSIFLQILGMGFRQASISYKKRERKTGVSKWTLSKKIKLFIDSLCSVLLCTDQDGDDRRHLDVCGRIALDRLYHSPEDILP